MSLRNPSQFSLWKEENIDASCLLKIRTNTENSPEKVFQARRAGVHSRMLVALSGYASIINARLEETNGKIQKMRRTKIHHVGDKVVAFGVVDNLVKGASGQAVQCMNLMLGLKETTGLDTPGLGV